MSANRQNSAETRRNRQGCGSVAMHGPLECRYGPDGICSGHFGPLPWPPPDPPPRSTRDAKAKRYHR